MAHFLALTISLRLNVKFTQLKITSKITYPNRKRYESQTWLPMKYQPVKNQWYRSIFLSTDVKLTAIGAWQVSGHWLR